MSEFALNGGKTPSLRAWTAELLSVSVAVTFVVVATVGNLEAAMGEFVLHMDERISFSQVQGILHSNSVLDAVQNAANGGELRYGRLFFMVAAIFSFFPELIWGEPGQIVATRSVGVISLAVSSFLLAKTVLNGSIFRFVLTAALLTLPFATYYASVPKPDPLQLLAITLFFFYNRGGVQLGRSWILLGVAVGLKVSALPVVLAVATILLVQSRQNRESTKNLLGTFFWFLVGVVVAIPLLIGPLFGVLILLFRISRGQKPNFFTLVLFGLLALPPLFLARDVLALVSSHILSNVGHGSDSSEVGFETWVSYFFTEWSGLPPIVLILGVLTTFSVLTVLFFQKLSEYSRTRHNVSFGIQTVMLLSGLFWLFAITLTTHRLWGMYLFPGAVLALTGVSGLLYTSLKAWEGYWGRSAIAIILVLGLIGEVGRLDATHREFGALYSREETAEFRGKLATRQQVDGLLGELGGRSASGLTVAVDPIEFSPPSHDGVEFTTFWGPFTSWGSAFDIILLSEAQIQYLNRCEKNSEFDSCREFGHLYREFVRSSPAACNSPICWIRFSDTPSGGQILVARSLFEKIE